MKPQIRVAGIIIRKDKMLMLKGRGYRELWTPGGKIEKGKPDEIKIYTDGAARGNPGRAGWAAVILFNPHPASPLPRGRNKERVFEIGGASKHATNNQMELTAPIEALKYLQKNCIRQDLTRKIEIFSDSKYVILGITEWIFNWQKNSWRNAAKKPVLNRKLWEELHELSRELKPKWTYVEGHAGDKWNERADEIATGFADGLRVKLKN